MAHRPTYPQNNHFQKLPTKGEHGNIRSILTKLQRRFSDNNKIIKPSRSVQRTSKTAPNTPLQEPRSPREAGNYSPTKEIENAISIFKSDEFRCLYNAKKNLRDSAHSNRTLPAHYEFQYHGDLVVSDRPSLYPSLDRESPQSELRNSFLLNNGHRNCASNLSGESAEIPVRCQDNGLQSKRLSITFGASQEAVGLIIKRLEQSEGSLSGIFIKGIHPNSPASRDGRLKVFDELLEVNGRPIRQFSYEQLKSIFSQRGVPLKLTIHRNSSAAVLHDIGYPIRNDNRLEDIPPYHSPSSSDPATEYLELSSDLREFGFFVVPGCGDYPVINHIVPDSVSYVDGRLRIGDELLRVNEHIMRNVASQRVTEIIQSFTHIHLKVRHQTDPLRTPTESHPMIEPVPSPSSTTPPYTVSVSLSRDARGSLGVTIKGIVSDSSDQVSLGDGIYVAKVTPDGPAALTGLVREGDRIVKVGDNDLRHLTPKQALALVKRSGSQVTLELERGKMQLSMDSMFDLDSNTSETRSHTKEPSFNRNSVSDTSEHPADVFTRDEDSVKSTSIHSGVSSIHGFYPSHLSEACLQFAHDPDGTHYHGSLSREERARLVDEWQPRVGSEKIVKIAQLSKYSAEGGIGIEIKPHPVFSQKRDLCGMRTVVSAVMEGPAREHGVLRKGDEILEINGVRVTDVHHDDVIKLIKATPQQVRLVIARPHCLGKLPSHYLMAESSPSTSEGESPPSGSPELRKKKLVKKPRDYEELDGHSTFPRPSARQQQGLITMQTDLDEVDGVVRMHEMKEKERWAQDQEIEKMENEKEKLEQEVFSRINNEDGNQLRHSLEQIKLKYEKDSTLPRPSKYSRKYPFKHALGTSSSSSYVVSGSATTPRAPKSQRKPKYSQPQPQVQEPLDPIPNIPIPNIPNNTSVQIQAESIDLSQDESTILNMVCVPFQRDSGTNNVPVTLIPFPTNTSSATTSEDESLLSPTKLSYPETHRLSPISQESEQTHHSRWDLEPQEITVTKGDSLGIGIERRLQPDSQGEYKVIVHDIIAGSASAKDGHLKIGDELLSINSYSVRGRTKEEVALHFTNLPRGPVILTVLHQQQDTLTKKDTEKLSSEKKRDLVEETNPPLAASHRKFAPLSAHQFPKRQMDKAYSLSTLSDGSKLEYFGSRITHSSSNSNNSLNDPSEPYPFNLSLFPPISPSSQQRQGLTNKVLDDFNMEQAGFESEGGHKHRRSKSLDLEQREENSSASLDDIPTRLLGHDLTFHPVVEDIGIKKGAKKDLNAPELTPPKQNLVDSYIKQNLERTPTVTENRRSVVPRGVIREVRLSRKSNANLGISIVEKYIPGGQSKGIFIKSISEPIILSGCLEQEDQILEVNGIDMKGFVHDQAVNLIKKASEPVFIKVIHAVESAKRISIDKIALENADLGGDIVNAFFTSGKKGSGIVVETAKPIKERMGKTYFKISEVLKRSRAEECRNVFKDDVIINVNGFNAVGMPHQQLLKLLNSPHSEVSLILSRPKTNLRSPHNTNSNEVQRSRRYLKTCLIDKAHEVEICVEAQQNSMHTPAVVISSVKSRHPSFREEIHPGDELVAINKQNLAGYKAESIQRWLHELQNDSQYEISFYSHAAQSSTSTGSGHSYEQEIPRGSYGRLSASQFTAMFYKEAKQDVGLVLVDGEVEGVFIEEVDPNGLAASDLRVRPGCKVIAVNDRKFLHDEANFVELVLNGVVGQFSLTLEGPYLHKIPRPNINTHGYFRYSSESSQELSTSHSPQAPKNLPPPMHNHPELDTKLGVRVVQLVREVDKGFGLTIRGGANTSHGDLPLFVGKVYPQQAAYRSGQVQERDVILAINDIPTTGMTRGEAVSMLKALNTVSFALSDEKDPIDDIVLPEHQNSLLFNDLTSSRESIQSREAFMPNNNSNHIMEQRYHHPYPQVSPAPVHYAFIPTYPANMYPSEWNAATPQYIGPPIIAPPHDSRFSTAEPPPYEMISHNLIVNPELILVSLKSPQRGFGFSISGGIDSQSGPQPILIKSMMEDGAAKLDGNLSIGDEIRAVNGFSLINTTHHQAVNILKQCQENLKPDQEVQLWIRKRHK